MRLVWPRALLSLPVLVLALAAWKRAVESESKKQRTDESE